MSYHKIPHIIIYIQTYTQWYLSLPHEAGSPQPTTRYFDIYNKKRIQQHMQLSTTVYLSNNLLPHTWYYTTHYVITERSCISAWLYKIRSRIDIQIGYPTLKSEPKKEQKRKPRSRVLRLSYMTTNNPRALI